MSTENPFRPAAAARYADAVRYQGKNTAGNLQIYDVGHTDPLSDDESRSAALGVIHLMRGKTAAEKKEVLEMMGLMPSVS